MSHDDADFDARIKADLETGRLDDAIRRALGDEHARCEHDLHAQPRRAMIARTKNHE
jgi:hypothetical protein